MQVFIDCFWLELIELLLEDSSELEEPDEELGDVEDDDEPELLGEDDEELLGEVDEELLGEEDEDEEPLYVLVVCAIASDPALMAIASKRAVVQERVI